MHFVQGTNGNRVGPIDDSQLVAWVKNGRIDRNTILVSVEEGDAIEAWMHPLLAPFFPEEKPKEPLPGSAIAGGAFILAGLAAAGLLNGWLGAVLAGIGAACGWPLHQDGKRLGTVILGVGGAVALVILASQVLGMSSR